MSTSMVDTEGKVRCPCQRLTPIMLVKEKMPLLLVQNNIVHGGESEVYAAPCSMGGYPCCFIMAVRLV